jgi:uncharacterized protein YndB with AHSA1/START domain
MVALQEEQTIQILNIVKEIEIAAPLEIAFEAMLAEMGPEAQMPDGTPYPLKLEAWPGGRWYRDLGDNIGHLWGHVQVIKPPKLIEICGPMFMSYAAASHLQYRLTEEGKGTHLKLTHTAFGMIPEDHRTGVNEGWQYKIERIRKLAEQKA